MALLPSYKSFNFHEVEEIEHRVFCPTPAKSDKDLKKSPGSLNIQEERNHKTAHHENIHNSKWDTIQHSIYSLLHPTKPKDSLVVHVNENFSEQLTTVDDGSDDEDTPHTSTHVTKKEKKKPARTKIVTNPPENLEIEESTRQETSPWQCLICRCNCKS